MKWRELNNDPVFKEIAEKYCRWSTPLVGLFGTVYGILYAFENLQSGNPFSSVLPGIFKALLFTGLGLIVLFVVILLHYWFRRRQ
jgi:biopolymer transport protein ExbB/TolQ